MEEKDVYIDRLVYVNLDTADDNCKNVSYQVVGNVQSYNNVTGVVVVRTNDKKKPLVYTSIDRLEKYSEDDNKYFIMNYFGLYGDLRTIKVDRKEMYRRLDEEIKKVVAKDINKDKK